ncbi:MAG TPA: site-2 protease family protein [Vicinamibacterales bacterium]
MRGQLRIARIAGIEVRLHYSWFLIAGLLTVSLAGQLYLVNPAWGAPLIWSVAVVTALAFFGALLAHELSHAAVARSRGIPVPEITLFALGGIAHMGRDAGEPETEFWMGLAGPAASLVIGFAALGLARALGWQYDVTPGGPGMAMLVWFGGVNVVLALFNMIPGFPLDGGRVLRAAIWGLTKDRVRATRIAGAIGQLVAVGLIVFGFFNLLRGAGFGALWLAFIGMFLLDAARASAAEVELSEALRGVRVGDVMARDCALIEPDRPLVDVVNEVLRTGRRCFFVMDDGHVAGMLTPAEMRAVDRERWATTPAVSVMRPLERLHRISPDAPVMEALELIGREDVNQLPVVEAGRLLGVISRDQILRLLAARAELPM